jgi:hypothetical protein
MIAHASFGGDGWRVWQEGVAGFHELRPLPYAEAGYGLPDEGQTVVNVADGKLLRLLVDDEPLDLRYGTVERYLRTLDLRAGTLVRELIWRSPDPGSASSPASPGCASGPAGCTSRRGCRRRSTGSRSACASRAGSCG